MFLTNKAGPLPVWGWLGIAGAGAAVLYKRGGSKPPNGQNMPGGQTIGSIDSVNASSAVTENQNLGWDAVPVLYAAGPSVSQIDGSFFGDGPLSLWTAGPMEYSDVFGGHGGRGRDRRRDARRGRGGIGTRGSGRDLFDPPPGAGGFGYHHSRGPNFPPVPQGGEGYENGGQNQQGFGGGRATGGGNPWAQQTTMGCSGNDYCTQDGDTLQGIAERQWGKGSPFDGLLSANANSLGDKGGNDRLEAGLHLTIPGAPSSGPPSPGGPAGNGMGAGGTQYGNNGNNHGSPTAGQSGGNSSRVKRGNASTQYVAPQGPTAKPPKAPQKSRPRGGRR